MESLVHPARGDLYQDKVRLMEENLGGAFEIYAELLKNKNIPESTVDERAAADAEAKAEVLQQKAAVRTAEIDLSYTQIYAAVSGEIGRATYSVGNYVGPGSGALA